MSENRCFNNPRFVCGFNPQTNPEDLRLLITDHKLWIDSDGKEGCSTWLAIVGFGWFHEEYLKITGCLLSRDNRAKQEMIVRCLDENAQEGGMTGKELRTS